MFKWDEQGDHVVSEDAWEFFTRKTATRILTNHDIAQDKLRKRKDRLDSASSNVCTCAISLRSKIICLTYTPETAQSALQRLRLCYVSRTSMVTPFDTFAWADLAMLQYQVPCPAGA